jgi:hypothetical protein
VSALEREKVDGTAELQAMRDQVRATRGELEALTKERRRNAEEKKNIFFHVRALQKENVLVHAASDAEELVGRMGRIEYEISGRVRREVMQKVHDEKAATAQVKGDCKMIQNFTVAVQVTQQEQKTVQLDETALIAHYNRDASAIRMDYYSWRDLIADYQRKIDESNIILGQKKQDLKVHTAFCRAMRDDRDSVARAHVQQIRENERVNGEIAATEGTMAAMKDLLWAHDQHALDMHMNVENTRLACIRIAEEYHELDVKLRRQKEENEVSGHDIVDKCRLVEGGREDAHRIRLFNEAITNTMRYLNRKLQTLGEEIALQRERARVFESEGRSKRAAWQTLCDQVATLETELRANVDREQLLLTERRRTDSLRLEVLRLEKMLLYATGQFHALQNEAANPRNVHRWAVLQGSDPAHWELISMRIALAEEVHLRRKRLDAVEAIKTELQKVVDNMALRLRKSYGGRIYEEVDAASRILREKSAQLIAMEETLRRQKPTLESRQSQVQSARSEAREERLETSSARQQYNEIQLAAGDPGGEQPIRAPCVPVAPRGRFIGGGFSVGKVDPVGKGNPVDEPKPNRMEIEFEKLRRPHTSRSKAVFRPGMWKRMGNENGAARPKSYRVQRE